MKPEQTKPQIDLWILAKLTTTNTPPNGYGNPYTVYTNNDVYPTLEAAQHQQLFEMLKNGVKYEIFHLEFPVV